MELNLALHDSYVVTGPTTRKSHFKIDRFAQHQLLMFFYLLLDAEVRYPASSERHRGKVETPTEGASYAYRSCGRW